MGVFLGTIGLFFVLFLLYARTFPVLALNEVKTILRATGEFGVKKNTVQNNIIATDSSNNHDIHSSKDDEF
jgi:molybdopterin-containing oxidoreductase family membrane subunit